MTAMTPAPGQVYRSATGVPMLYVRTEKRSMHQPDPEHLFVCTRERAVFQMWTSEVPPEFDLIHEPPAADRDLLLSLLSEACDMLPEADAQGLKLRYQRERPS